MSQATSGQIIAASADVELRERIIAIASQMPEVENPQAFVASKLLKIVGLEIDAGGEPSSIAKVYEYADSVRKQKLAELPQSPGSNPAAVTDDYIRAALVAVAPAAEPQPEA